MATRTPQEDLVNERIINRGIHRRSDEVVAKMLTAVTDKSTRFDEGIDELTNFPQSYLWKLKLRGITGQEADDELVNQLQFYTNKKTRLLDKKMLMEKEQEFRRDSKVTRREIID